MKTILKLPLFLISASLGVMALCACSDKQEEPQKEPTVLYKDYADFEFDDWKFTHKETYSVSTQSGNNREVKTKYKYKNTSSETKILELKSLIAIKEDNGAKYTAYYNLGDKSGASRVRVEAGLSVDLQFRAVIPTSIETENYQFVFNFNGNDFLFHLYSKPDELRKDCEVTYYMDGKVLETAVLKEGRLLRDFIHDWHSSDWQYGCCQWFTNPELTEYADSALITDGLKIYGTKTPMLAYADDNEEDGTLLGIAVNITVDNGAVYVPRQFEGKRVRKLGRGSMAPYENSPKYAPNTPYILYLPKGIILEDPFNLAFDYTCHVATIYYEGSEEDWAAMYSGKSVSNIDIKYNQPGPTE